MKIDNHLSLENNSNLKLPLYFISDTHISTILSEHEIEKRKKLFSFFEEVIKTKGTLFLLGDFFDFWYNYGDYIPKNLIEIVEYLKKIINSGIEIHYVAGNHDYWIDGLLTKKYGINFYPDKIEFLNNNNKFLLLHGDGLLKEDYKYRILKKVLRSKIIINLFKLFPAPSIYKIGEKVSNVNRRYIKPTEDSKEIDEMVNYLKKKNNEGYNVAMMGHVHYPKFEKINDKYSVILGDWLFYMTYAIWDGKELSHLEWKNNI